MTTTTERITVFVSPEEKSRIASMAQLANVSMSELLRRAAQSFQPGQDPIVMDMLIDRMFKSTQNANRAIDETLRYVEASNQRMATTSEFNDFR
ncbi:plasmid mobilization protein [Modicisalibacter muralis]|nr:ribbon-helix-helix protein, CopG family [Halomonas muralis]